jgi:hypothetical protein
MRAQRMHKPTDGRLGAVLPVLPTLPRPMVLLCNASASLDRALGLGALGAELTLLLTHSLSLSHPTTQPPEAAAARARPFE